MSDAQGGPATPAINPWMIAFSVVLATFMEVLDTSISAVTLPHIAGSVSASNDEATWVLTSYLVANAIVLPVSPWLSQRIGRRRLLLLSITIFTIASFACGAANSLVMIVLARTIQGAGGGALQPLSQAILLESFPPRQRGQAMAVFSLGVLVAPVLGPTVGGWLAESYSWRWAYYVNVPIGILALLMVLRYVHDPDYIRNAKPGGIDSIGLGLLAVWMAALQIILDRGQEDDWFDATWIRWSFVVMILCFVAFLVCELRRRDPLVRLRVFRHRNFLICCVLLVIYSGMLYALITLLPLFYQELMGYTALNAGLAVSPRGLGAVVAMPLLGALSNRIDNRYMMAGGFALVGVTSLYFSHMTLQISQWTMLWPIMLWGFGAGVAFVPLATLSVAELPNEEIGNASGLFNLLRNIGGSIGISVVNTIVARHEQMYRSVLVQHLSTANTAVSHMLQGATTLMQQNGRRPLLTYKLLDGTLRQQARLLAYTDNFRYMALLCFVCVPLVFYLHKAKAHRSPQ